MKLLAIEEVTPSRNVGVENKEDAIAIEAARKRRSAFNFKIVGISAGAELKFIRDENIKCVVAPDQKHVIFHNEEMSTSEAAAKILKSKWWPQGPSYWVYDGETLEERRIRIESGIEYSDKEIEEAGDQWLSLQADIARGK